MMNVEFGKKHFWPDNKQLIENKKDGCADDLLPLVKDANIFAIITDINIATAQFISDNISKAEQWNLLLAINPAGVTRQNVLNMLEDLQEKNKSLIKIRVILPRMLREQKLNVNLVLIWKKNDKCWLNIGSTQSLGIKTALEGTANLLFEPDAHIIEECRKFIDLHWQIGVPLNKKICTIPDLIPAKGTEEALLAWNQYQDQCLSNNDVLKDENSLDSVIIDDRGEIVVPKGEKISETMELPNISNFELKITEIMKRGRGATVKYRSQPLRAPLSSRFFGVEATTRVGTVTREVQYKVDLFDEKEQKKMDKYRNSVRELLTLCSYSLSDGLRWVPDEAVGMLDDLITRSADEASQELNNLLNNDIDAFLNSRRKKIRGNCQIFYMEMTGNKEMPEEKIDLVMQTLHDRAEQAINGEFLPKVTYTDVSFSPTRKNKNVDVWGHVTPLLMDIAERPRKFIADPYARRGLRKDMSLEGYFKAMDVIDDCIIRSYSMEEAGVVTKANEELEIIKQLKKINIDDESVCQLLLHLMEGKLKQNNEETFNERFNALMTLGYVLIGTTKDCNEWKHYMIYHCGEEVESCLDIIYKEVSSWSINKKFDSKKLSSEIEILKQEIHLEAPVIKEDIKEEIKEKREQRTRLMATEDWVRSIPEGELKLARRILKEIDLTKYPYVSKTLATTEQEDNILSYDNEEVNDATPTFNVNHEKQGIEIKFNTKPNENVLAGLKESGFRWSQSERLWYSTISNQRAINYAKSIGYKSEEAIEFGQ